MSIGGPSPSSKVLYGMFDLVWFGFGFGFGVERVENGKWWNTQPPSSQILCGKFV